MTGGDGRTGGSGAGEVRCEDESGAGGGKVRADAAPEARGARPETQSFGLALSYEGLNSTASWVRTLAVAVHDPGPS